MQIAEHLNQHRTYAESSRRSDTRTRDLLTPFMMMSVGVAMAMVVVMLDSAGTLAYPLGLIGGIAVLPWIVAAIPVSSRYRASEQGFSSLVMTLGVFVGFSGLTAGHVWPFVAGLAVAGVALTMWAVARRVERT
jgi:hypothetical protein